MLSLFDNSIVTATRGWDEQAATATAQDLPDITADAERARLQEVRNTLVSYLPSRSTISKIALVWYPLHRTEPNRSLPQQTVC